MHFSAAVAKRLFPRRPSKEPLAPREDTEELWHARAGHLSSEATEQLVWSAKGVRINGIRRRDCESCALAHAEKVVSRRTSPTRSTRPFWRILWDLFDYPRAFDGSRWLLVIKDEFSGKLFAFPLVKKDLANVFTTIRNFESWVHRQYGLDVCKIRQDNDTSVIGIKGYTEYEIWAQECGIDLEPTPEHTSEPNGGAERAGKELITKALAMRIGAGLPEDLWSEVTMAAAWLYNMSPSPTRNYHSPNEVLEAWFRQYFRWYQPSVVHALTTDLRPDWSGIYAYGCRAYPLAKEREAGIDKRAYKVKPRAHIGYLVGYRASNIYRVWVPQLKRVITTRNVTFDERLFYKKDDEPRDLQSVAVTRRIVELIDLPVGLQDAGDVLEGTADGQPNNPNASSPDHLGGGPLGAPTPKASKTPSGDDLDTPEGSSQSSGVEPTGLRTPERTPEPRPGAGTGSSGTDHATSDGHGGSNSSPTEPRSPESAPGEHSRSPPLSVSADTAPHGTITVAGGAPAAQTHGGMPDVAEPWADVSDDSGVPAASSTTPEEPKPKRKYMRKVWGPPTRHSRRRQGRSPDPGSGSGGLVSFALPMYQEDNISIPDQEAWHTFCHTYLPDIDRAIHRGDDGRYRTLHAVFAAAVRQTRDARPGATPSRPRLHFSDLTRLPRRWKDLAKHPLGKEFVKACEDEIRNLVNRKTWRKIRRELAKAKPLPLKWVFNYKFDENGMLNKCKARICVRGDLQEHDTLQSTYAATLAARSFRTMMAIAAFFNLEVKQYDVAQAFLNANHPEGVVCELPEGFEEEGMCVELERALYGLRESPLLWYREFSSTLRKLGLTASSEEPCLFFDRQRRVVVLFYVDDYLVFYHKDHEEEANRIMGALKEKYEVHEQGDVKWFLGIRVLRDRAQRKVWLVHDQYLEKIANRFGVANWDRFPNIPLPVVELEKHTGTATRAQIKLFQELVGSILYTACMLHPEAAFPAAKLSQFLTNPSQQHIQAALHVIAYLYGARFLAIQYGGLPPEAPPTQILMVAGDASFADDTDTRRSSQGYLILLFGGLVNWKAARQDTVTTSSTEAELLALSATARETMAFKRFLADIQLELGVPWTVFCDNTQTIRLVVGENERISTRLRHVDVHNLWVRQEHAKGSFEVAYLPTSEMPADGLTKLLTRQKFEHFRALLNLQDVRHIIQSQGAGDEKSI